MVGKITKVILLTKDHNELQRIYDKYPGKCKQWNAAFMINIRTPDNIKESIKREDPDLFKMFVDDLEVGRTAVSAFTSYDSNYWGDDKTLSSVKEISDTRTTLLDGCYFDCDYPGFVPDHIDLVKPITCVGDKLPEAGLYWVLGKGFVIQDEEGEALGLDGKAISRSFRGNQVCKIYSADDLFEFFKPEEQMFEALAEELERSKTPEIYSNNPQVIIETLAEIFSEEEVSESVEQPTI